MPPAKGALPPAALRLAPPRSPRGRGAGRAAYGLLTCPPCLSVCRFDQRQGFGFARNAHPFGARAKPCAPLRLPLSPLTLLYADSGSIKMRGFFEIAASVIEVRSLKNQGDFEGGISDFTYPSGSRVKAGRRPPEGLGLYSAGTTTC